MSHFAEITEKLRQSDSEKTALEEEIREIGVSLKNFNTPK
jgi:hypothetical protein